MDRAEALKRAYGLAPHPEGGSFREEWTSQDALPDGRALAGSIYFMLEGDEVSHLHRIDCDEVWYYHEGCGLRVWMVDGEGRVSAARLGPDAAAGERMMVAIPRGVIFGAENLDPEGYSFVSCATAPRFSYGGFELIGLRELAAACPAPDAALSRLAWPEDVR